MQQTDKYQFNLIETSDPFSPEPLNENTRALEAQLSSLSAAKADQTALTAETAAREALDAARLRYKLDSYKGTDAKTVRLEFDFKPLLLIVTAQGNYLYGGHPWIRGAKYGRAYFYTGTARLVSPVWEDRAVQWDNYTSTNAMDWLNDASTTYNYLAIGVAE